MGGEGKGRAVSGKGGNHVARWSLSLCSCHRAASPIDLPPGDLITLLEVIQASWSATLHQNRVWPYLLAGLGDEYLPPLHKRQELDQEDIFCDDRRRIHPHVCRATLCTIRLQERLRQGREGSLLRDTPIVGGSHRRREAECRTDAQDPAGQETAGSVGTWQHLSEGKQDMTRPARRSGRRSPASSRGRKC